MGITALRTTTTNVSSLNDLSALTDETAIHEYLLTQEDPWAWKQLGRCREADPEAFFPEKGASARQGKRVCESCEVRQICLQYALENDENYGTWGGTTPAERRELQMRDPRRGALSA